MVTMHSCQGLITLSGPLCGFYHLDVDWNVWYTAKLNVTALSVEIDVSGLIDISQLLVFML